MIRNLFCVVFVLFSYLISAQEIIVGKIINSENNSEFPYVNIGIIGKSVGTVSDKDGNYKLKLTNQIEETDEVVFSYIGYKTAKYMVSYLRKTNIVVLEPDTNVIDEVAIHIDKKKTKEKKLGRKNIGLDLTFWGFYSNYEHDVVDDALSKETGMLVKIKNNTWVTGLNFKISTNQYKHLKFRINFYKTEKGIPSELLFTDKNIIFDIKDGRTGWFNVDLKEYDIYLEKNTETVVAIQWLESEKMHEHSKFFSIPVSMVGGTQFIRNKAMDNWKKHKQSLSFYLSIIETD